MFAALDNGEVGLQPAHLSRHVRVPAPSLGRLPLEIPDLPAPDDPDDASYAAAEGPPTAPRAAIKSRGPVEAACTDEERNITNHGKKHSEGNVSSRIFTLIESEDDTRSWEFFPGFTSQTLPQCHTL
jgi:hypothetical protein